MTVTAATRELKLRLADSLVQHLFVAYECCPRTREVKTLTWISCF